MMRYLTLLLLSFLLTGCLEGPAGPAGPAGENGEDGEDGADVQVRTKSGILDTTLFHALSDDWHIAWSQVTDSSFVQVRIRSNGSTLWQTPFFYVSDGLIRIPNNGLIANYHYKIIVGIPAKP